jgi:hypothetical protein
MTKEELQWLSEIYEYYILPARTVGKSSLNCSHWSRLLFMNLKSSSNKIILENKKHSVLLLEGVYIDVEFNAFIVGFDWKSTAITDQAKIVRICSKYPPETSQIYKFYSSPATEGSHLWHNKVI